MPEITFPHMQNVPFEVDVVTFPAIVDGKKIVCRITQEEIEREFNSGMVIQPGQLEAAFLRFRSQIEDRAKQQILDKAASVG